MSRLCNCFLLWWNCQEEIIICPFGNRTSIWEDLHEGCARNAYTKYLIDKHHEDATVTRTGFHIDRSRNWIGASPDGLVYDPSSKNDPHWLLEIKCPATVLSLHHLKICVVDHTFP